MLRSRFFVLTAIAIWLVATAYAYSLMMRFDTRPGVAGNPLLRWPATAAVQLAKRQRTLLIFLHPKCSCSRASISQLQNLRKRFPDAFHTELVLWQPPGRSPAWNQLYRTDSEDLSGTETIADPGGRVAALFDAHTSGYVLLYGAAGNLEYAGGLTPARGVNNEGPGILALERIMSGSTVGVAHQPVFGCGF